MNYWVNHIFYHTDHHGVVIIIMTTLQSHQKNNTNTKHRRIKSKIQVNDKTLFVYQCIYIYLCCTRFGCKVAYTSTNSIHSLSRLSNVCCCCFLWTSWVDVSFPRIYYCYKALITSTTFELQNIFKEWVPKIYSKNELQKYIQRMSYKNLFKEWVTKIYSKNELQIL